MALADITPISARRVVLDTGVLLVFVVGIHDPRLLGRIRHTKNYVPGDFDLLERLLEECSTVCATPNGFTELSNLLGKVEDKRLRELRAAMTKVIRATHEQYVSSRDACTHRGFSWLGLADAAIATGFEPNDAILTTDPALHTWLGRIGRNAFNFNHYRTIAWS